MKYFSMEQDAHAIGAASAAGSRHLGRQLNKEASPEALIKTWDMYNRLQRDPHEDPDPDPAVRLHVHVQMSGLGFHDMRTSAVWAALM